MEPLDHWITQLGNGATSVLLMASLLGLRHATDPDHIAAISTLVLGSGPEGASRARVLGMAWGLGHGVTLFLFGLPIMLFRNYLPPLMHQIAELIIAAIIIVLAVRLLLRWHRGYFHAHPHAHQGRKHTHPHLHEHSGKSTHPTVHQHRHVEAIGRSPLAAFGIGLVHGVGGSAGAGILLVGAAPSTTTAVLALLLFAAGTAISMTIITWAFGALFGRSPGVQRSNWVIPALGLVSFCFGVWYAFQGFKPMPN